MEVFDKMGEVAFFLMFARNRTLTLIEREKAPVGRRNCDQKQGGEKDVACLGTTVIRLILLDLMFGWDKKYTNRT